MSEEVKKFLQGYQGNSKFFLSLKSQLERCGSLSEKQIACVEKAMRGERPARREESPRSEAPAPRYPDRFIFVVLKQIDEASQVMGSSWDEATANEMAEKITDQWGPGYVVSTKVTYTKKETKKQPKNFMSALEAI